MNKVPSKESALGWENQAAITAEGPVLEIEIIKLNPPITLNENLR